jgi:GNAT superfamily N-acetyltransferase
MNAGPGMALKPDPWLGERLSKPAWRLTDTGRELETVPLPRETPCFADVRVPVNEIEIANRLQCAGFRLIDTSIQLERSVWPVGQSRTSRFAVPEDRAAVQRIAERSFTFSRFHLDPAIPKSAADRIKRDWAGNFFSGDRGDAMVVSVVNDEVGGFLQLLHRDDVLTIDLIAVDARFRGKGLARDMIRFAEAEIPGVQRLKVGTQAANARSLHTYVADKFQFMNATYIFHFHG